MTEPTLYERLGGVNAIAMVVDRFSDQIVKNPKLNMNPALKEWNESGQLPGLKLANAVALPSCRRALDYTGKELGEAHKDLHLTAEEFDEVGAEIASALDHFNVQELESRKSWPP